MSATGIRLSALYTVVALALGCGQTTDPPIDVIDEITEVQIVEVKDVGGDVPFTGTVTAVIGPEGGELELGGASVSIPPGALDSEVELGVTWVPKDSPDIPDDQSQLGQVIAFTPHGMKFNLPVTVTVPFLDVQDTERQLLVSQPGGAWEVVPGTEVVGDTMVAQVDHFSFLFVAGVLFPCADNGQCGEDAFCEKEDGDCEGMGFCRLRYFPGDSFFAGDVCAELSGGVCGCDGVEYDTACAARAAGASAAFRRSVFAGFPERICPAVPCTGYSDCAGHPEYCAKEPGLCDEGTGLCAIPPDEAGTCAFASDPVCSCRGYTYDNVCEANERSLNLLYETECPPQADCLDNSDCEVYEYCEIPTDGMYGDCDDPGTCSWRLSPEWTTCIGLTGFLACGCDGVVYDHECSPKQAGTNVQFMMNGGAYQPTSCPAVPCTDDSDCETDEFCATDFGECGGDGFCVTPPEDPCPPDAPGGFVLCGCDGVEYGTTCSASQAGTSLVSMGPCVSPPPCTENSDCEATEYCKKSLGDCEGEGVCTEQPTTDPCPDGFLPYLACGCDGVTYDNKCTMAVAGTNPEFYLSPYLHFAPSGCPAVPCTDDSECDPGDFCARDFGECTGDGFCSSPYVGPGPVTCMAVTVCGCDDVEYGSSCSASEAGVNIASSGACGCVPDCDGKECGDDGCGGDCGDCDDANDCTDDSCDPQMGCVHTDNTAACEDGNACTTGDTCAGGQCVPGSGALDCDDANDCTDDSCDPAIGCVNADNSEPCDDEDACSASDACEAGVCAGAGWVVCPDPEVCHLIGSCDPVTGLCEFPLAQENTPCPDEDLCNGDELCDAVGDCQTGALLDCDDGNECTDDDCDPSNGCWHANNSLPCDDMDACSQVDVCESGTCTGTDLVVCESDVPCIVSGPCNPATGLCGTTVAQENTPCADEDLCNGDELCDAAGTCQPGTPVDCDDGDVCTDDACDPSNGCWHAYNTVPCDDNDACTEDEHCLDGVCNYGNSVDCDDGNPCTEDKCDTSLGCLNPPVIPGTPCQTPLGQDGTCQDGVCATECAGDPDCDDGIPCTMDTCDTVAGTCVFEPVHADCDDGNFCTDDECTLANGCVNTNNTQPCDDNDACTIPDTCDGGSCVGGNPPDCDDKNVCTDDSCDSSIGCVNANNTLPCDDSDACTTPDTCSGGTCTGGAPTDCDDQNPCTDDSCDPAMGCVNAYNSIPCDDENECTEGDVCSQGTCTSGSNVDCDDGNACTTEYCNAMTGCVYIDGTGQCDDNDACTENEYCKDGICNYGQSVDCDDGNVCTDDSCDTTTGCVNAPNSSPCDDNDKCTGNDVCAQGTCAGGPPVDCDDQNVCTEDSCDSASGCLNAPTNPGSPCQTPLGQDGTCQNGVCSPECTSAPDCDDGIACTTDTCDTGAGKCVFTPVHADCDDGNFCTDDTCTLVNGCQNVNNSLPCDDNNACTENEFCGDGVCNYGQSVDCDDNNTCTEDSCDTATGCVNTETVVCDDQIACTSDSCDPQGGCVFTNVDAACTPPNPCKDNFCNPLHRGSDADGCVFPDKDCNDGNECTDDTCDPATGCVFTNNTAMCIVGICSPFGADYYYQPPVYCTDGECIQPWPTPESEHCAANACTTVTCDPVTGCITTNNSLPCDDGDVCTTVDTCSGGICVGGSPLDCDDQNLCTDDSCNLVTGCVNTNNNAACDDNDACTTPDTCSGGTCVGGNPPDCDDQNECTDDSCDPATGCVNTNNTAACDDNDACTTPDTCSGGTCVGGNPPDCNDNNVCTDDSCDPATGCVNANNTAACDDGDVCTTVDVCIGEVCVGGAPLDCDDQNVCTNDSCDLVAGCVHTNNTAPCSDSYCEDGTYYPILNCSSGTCPDPAPVDCNDGNVCTDDSCDSATGCVNTNNVVQCAAPKCDADDFFPAVNCLDGTCPTQVLVDCDDQNLCTTDTCDPAIGCVNQPPAQCPFDCGDAPDPNYPTLLSSAGACHVLGQIYLGSSVDAELDGIPTSDALGDDGDNLGDEDGVFWMSPVNPGSPASVDVVASSAGLLNGWVDFNRDGDWEDADEQVFTDKPLVAGTNNLSFDVPGNAVLGLTFSRYRFDALGGLSTKGWSMEGEVEDHAVYLEMAMEYDYGDAPDPTYPTVKLNYGARHILDGITYLGQMVDPEPNGIPGPGADGDDLDNDDDEDGVIFTSPILMGVPATLDVLASSEGFLTGWVDFNQNGTWLDPEEQVFMEQHLVPGPNPLGFMVPQTAVPGQTYARFRFSTYPVMTPDGDAQNGEVEDYLIEIMPP